MKFKLNSMSIKCLHDLARYLQLPVLGTQHPSGMAPVRNIVVSVFIIVGMFAVGTPTADAGTTCKIVPSWCPPSPGGEGGGSSVPEPASLLVLAAGACAAGLAARRRNKK